MRDNGRPVTAERTLDAVQLAGRGHVKHVETAVRPAAGKLRAVRALRWCETNIPSRGSARTKATLMTKGPWVSNVALRAPVSRLYTLTCRHQCLSTVGRARHIAGAAAGGDEAAVGRHRHAPGIHCTVLRQAEIVQSDLARPRWCACTC